MRLLIVDGYNVLHATDRYRALVDHDLDAARARLVSDVAAYASGGAGAIVVFDGAANPASTGAAHDIAGITVIFSPYGRDADTVIEDLVVGRRSTGDEIELVTSDAQTQWVALSNAVKRVSSAEFVREMSATESEWLEHNPTGTRKGTLDERVDRATRDTLARWARGAPPE